MIGLRQKILSASSEEEVDKLLTDGKKYEFASTKTRNSWQNAAKRKKSGERYVATTVAGGSGKKKPRRSR